MPPRPSDERRKALNQELTIPMVSNFFPLDRYYEAADKVYHGFQQSYQKAFAKNGKISKEQDSALDDAYVYGKRYCTFCLDSLPQHGYYGTVKYRALQRQHTTQITQVLDQLELVAQKMDTYETLRQRHAKEVARQAQEAKEQEELLRFAALQQRVELQKQTTASDLSNIEASALSKLQLLLPSQPRIPCDPSGSKEPPLGPPSTRYSLRDDTEDEDETLPPPGVPTTAQQPPAYHQVVKGRRQGSNFWGPSSTSGTSSSEEESTSKNGFSNGSHARDDSSDDNGAAVFAYQPPSAPAQQPPKKKPRKIPLRTLQQQYEQDYIGNQQAGKIRVTALDTYQGRVNSSTNGCTVISALVVSHHLQSNGRGIQNSQVTHVMDSQCGPLLRAIRSKLGLGGHALIIPSDVHDHLVDCKLLPQEKFLGAAGGNILNPDHLNEFLKLLAAAPHQAAATLFFREHVISVVKYPAADSNGGKRYYSYDLIDSLPGASGMATRTICQGLEALIVLLKWYAARKLNANYVDQNVWNDGLADVDPRVFQGFVWGEQAQ
jgi:hypothetical protein